MKFTGNLVAIASLLAFVRAHDEAPKTASQVEQYKRQQESIYHCAPQIALYNAARKRARREQAQQVLSGQAPTDASTLFLEEAFAIPEKGETKNLECKEAVVEPKIRNNTCVLSPETTQGPYYHDRGHPIRQNMAEYQLGLPWYMDVGVIDVKTCKPLEGVLVDVWHANSTGHYAGHPEQEEKLKWEGPKHEGPRKGLLSKYPRTEPEQTFLRAAWPTNKNGVSQYTSIFPGYYTGRATHVHVKVHTQWTPHANGTFTSSRLIHTGQFFVPDDINVSIDKIHPYTENPIKNKWGRTRNWEDSLEIYQSSHAVRAKFSSPNGYGPTFDIEMVGGVIQQGLIGYITVGVDTTASYNPTEAWSP
ncbi:hypothetical protein P7C70_g3517, partial [Phenoliferia sp. Uapishka_3]